MVGIQQLRWENQSLQPSEGFHIGAVHSRKAEGCRATMQPSTFLRIRQYLAAVLNISHQGNNSLSEGVEGFSTEERVSLLGAPCQGILRQIPTRNFLSIQVLEENLERLEMCKIH